MESHVNLILVTLINVAIVCLVVVLHNAVLIRLSGLLSKMRQSQHFRLIVAVLGCLTAHALEVWLFAVPYYLMHNADGWGELLGNFNGSLLDCVYFSFTTFTTLGYGDIQALGPLRYLTGIEGLTGLVLITWSASFLFVEMQRYWPAR
ncbi:MAG: ion channel [Pseudomonadota bacterium]|nr:ion channel [Pseudomonadota bacterium]